MITTRTTITDLLDARGISYRVLLHSEPVFTVEAAARQRGVLEEEMVKCILLRERAGRYVMACVRGCDRVDPKAVRLFLPDDCRRLSFASAEEILSVTGCVQGAVAPLPLPAGLPLLFDEAIARRARVSLSSGDVMAGLELDPLDLIRVAGATLARIAERG